MRILFVTHSFNSLAQRLYVELSERAHEVSIELDISDAVTIEACALFRPELIIAPFLKRAIPEAVWREHVCLVVHPGIKGDRGPSALDWAIQAGETRWGVTVLQAAAVMDAGDIWATRAFQMREACKSSLYRGEVTEAAVAAVLEAVDKFAAGGFSPEPLEYAKPDVCGRAHPLMRQDERRIDWQHDDTATVLRKLRAADSVPGVLDEIAGKAVYMYNARAERTLRGGLAGAVIAKRNGAILRATSDGALWLGHLKPASAATAPAFKLPAAQVLGARLDGVPDLPLPCLPMKDDGTYQDICYEEAEGVGYLHFPFYNGAMSTGDCLRLRDAFVAACARDIALVVLMGGADFWCNGIHLNVIEAADSPADESWANINAMNDLCLAIIESPKPVVAALHGNAGAGGCFLALTADRLWARRGVVLNPHYKGMGNLYGSEYWTYLLPKRVGTEQALALTRSRLPIAATQAQRLGFIDETFGAAAGEFASEVRARARDLVGSGAAARLQQLKRTARLRDEAEKPLARYRGEELEHMKLNFYGFDPSYHVARYHFVNRVPHAWTPLHLARHRQNIWQSQGLLHGRVAAEEGVHANG